MKNFANQVLKFNKTLNFYEPLPKSIQVINPFSGNKLVEEITNKFYTNFYNDQNTRIIILGINPGRLGTASTGIPFTDVKRLKKNCLIDVNIKDTHEISSEFIYDVIKDFGGVSTFYNSFYISSVCPIGFVELNDKNTFINRNYYDNSLLEKISTEFIIQSLKKQLKMNIRKDVCICLGTGKNKIFLSKLNEKYHFFDKIIYLEHPRYIMQYKRKRKQDYIDKYIDAFKSLMN